MTAANSPVVIDLTLDDADDNLDHDGSFANHEVVLQRERRSPSVFHQGVVDDPFSLNNIQRRVREMFPDLCEQHIDQLCLDLFASGLSGAWLFDAAVARVVEDPDLFPPRVIGSGADVGPSSAGLKRKSSNPHLSQTSGNLIIGGPSNGDDSEPGPRSKDIAGMGGVEIYEHNAKRRKTRGNEVTGSGSVADPFTIDDSADSPSTHASDEPKLIECGCCFVEYLESRMTMCDSMPAHFFCLSCAQKHIETMIGQTKCRPSCMDLSGCKAPFSRQELLRFLNHKTLAKLESLQQDEEIRAACLEGLHECPFCDFKAIPPPIEEDREFRCLNEECGRVSCRLCNKISHTPMGCEEAARHGKESAQHMLEEARSEAMMRSCNKCGTKFVKDSGCNKMACPKPSCRNLQCYVCRKTIENYNHFGEGRCPLFENTEARHADEVKAAEEEVKKRLRAANPDLTEEELELKFSEKVEQDEKRRFDAAEAETRGRRPQRNVLPGINILPIMPVGNIQELLQQQAAVAGHAPPFGRRRRQMGQNRPLIHGAGILGNLGPPQAPAAPQAQVPAEDVLNPEFVEARLDDVREALRAINERRERLLAAVVNNGQGDAALHQGDEDLAPERLDALRVNHAVRARNEALLQIQRARDRAHGLQNQYRQLRQHLEAMNEERAQHYRLEQQRLQQQQHDLQQRLQQQQRDLQHRLQQQQRELQNQLQQQNAQVQHMLLGPYQPVFPMIAPPGEGLGFQAMAGPQVQAQGEHHAQVVHQHHQMARDHFINAPPNAHADAIDDVLQRHMLPRMNAHRAIAGRPPGVNPPRQNPPGVYAPGGELQQ